MARPSQPAPFGAKRPTVSAKTAAPPSRNLLWLASYPKSGNTWTRIFLANYLFNAPRPLPINEVHRLGMGDSIPKSYAMVAKGPFDVASVEQTLTLRPKVLAAISRNGADINFVKTHNIRDAAFDVPLIPTTLTRSAIYIVRNPLDVVVSYARHYGQSVEDATDAIARREHTTRASEGSVTQFLGNWSDHVRSWTRSRDFPVTVVRYEDMKDAPHATFGRMLDAIGVPIDDARLDKAIQFSSFDELKKQETESGFVERSANSESFFHTGRAGQWRDVMQAQTVARIEDDHGAVMREFGYL